MLFWGYSSGFACCENACSKKPLTCIQKVFHKIIGSVQGQPVCAWPRYLLKSRGDWGPLTFVEIVWIQEWQEHLIALLYNALSVFSDWITHSFKGNTSCRAPEIKSSVWVTHFNEEFGKPLKTLFALCGYLPRGVQLWPSQHDWMATETHTDQWGAWISSLKSLKYWERQGNLFYFVCRNRVITSSFQ